MNRNNLWHQLSLSARLERRRLETAASARGHHARAEKPQRLRGSLGHSHEGHHSTCRGAGEDSQGVRIVHPLDFETTLTKMKRQQNKIH